MKKSLIVLLILLAGCSPGRLMPGSAQETVDWVDFVMWDDTTYEADYEANQLNQTWQKGKELGEVEYKLDGHATSKHKTKNGDAAFLSKGTKIYEMVDYDSSFRILADNKMYEVSIPENAKVLGDFLDIRGKVEKVYFLSQIDETLIGEMSNDVTEQFITDYLALDYDSNVRTSTGTSGDRVFIQFVFKDGTNTKTSYWLESGVFWSGAIATDSLEKLLAKELININF